MGLQQFLLAFMSAGAFFFAIYYLSAVILIHKKFFDKHTYFVIASFFSSVFIFFQLLPSLNYTEEQYLLFHNIRGICAILEFPFYFLVILECFYRNANKKIFYISIFLIPLDIILVFFGKFISFPVRRIIIETPFSDFIYNAGTANVGYIIWGIPLLIIVLVYLIKFLFFNQEQKKLPFPLITIGFLPIFINDASISNGYIKNIYLFEYYFFFIASFIFYEFIKEDSKSYITVVNLSKELLKHKEDLEIKVEERTKELKAEKEISEFERQKSDNLLLNVLPEPIAIRLKDGETLIADHFEEASVIFIDIADFTKLSAKSTPQKMVKMLNDVFTIFDKVSAKYGIEKIKTIGDCYMAAAGIPVPRVDHVQAISMMALEAMEAIKDYRTEDGNEIKFRIGLDCGPIVAGVIGEQKFIYDLWGDMVNTASRMETNGIVGKIQCTERFKDTLGNTNGFKFEDRGEIEIKGKGMMKTYFLEKV